MTKEPGHGEAWIVPPSEPKNEPPKGECLCGGVVGWCTVVVWLATNSKVFEPETTSLWKCERESSGKEFPNLDMVDNHQSSQEMASPVPDNAASKEETREWRMTTERFLDSLALSKVSEPRPGGIS